MWCFLGVRHMSAQPANTYTAVYGVPTWTEPSKGAGLSQRAVGGARGCARGMHVMAQETCCMCSQDAGLLAGGAGSTAGLPVGDMLHSPNDGLGVREEVRAANDLLIRRPQAHMPRPHAIWEPLVMRSRRGVCRHGLKNVACASKDAPQGRVCCSLWVRSSVTCIPAPEARLPCRSRMPRLRRSALQAARAPQALAEGPLQVLGPQTPRIHRRPRLRPHRAPQRRWICCPRRLPRQGGLRAGLRPLWRALTRLETVQRAQLALQAVMLVASASR